MIHCGLKFRPAIALPKDTYRMPPGKIKMPSLHIGTRTGINLRYHLDCQLLDRLTTVPTHRLPVNAGLRQKILRYHLFPLPSAVHLLLRFSPHSQHRGLSVDAPAVLSPLLRFACIEFSILNTLRGNLSRGLEKIFFGGGRMSTSENRT